MRTVESWFNPLPEHSFATTKQVEPILLRPYSDETTQKKLEYKDESVYATGQGGKYTQRLSKREEKKILAGRKNFLTVFPKRIENSHFPLDADCGILVQLVTRTLLRNYKNGLNQDS